ncbi:MAG: ABC transporter permease [Bacteroidota bacterium]|nr:ABC transporter permease [Bacteroidota bacterium]MDP4190329.1 ABC transporter permease [Bacteroidota bacterium]MDP4193543.1 ABC transporter permease [Bacteroidota bacterium]
MNSKNIFKVAIRSILKSRMRGLLTTLGIIIGVASVIIMVAIGQGAQENITQQISALGSNLIIIYPGTTASGGVNKGAGSFNRFTLEDVEKIRKKAVYIKGITPIVRTSSQVIGPGGNWNTSIEGVSTDFQEVRNWKLKSGAFFSDRDLLSRSKVAVIGTDIVTNLFPSQEPVGKYIRIRNVPFKIIGVLESKGQSTMGPSNDDIIIAPSTTVLDRLVGGRYINLIQASAKSVELIDSAQVELRLIMRDSHRLNETEDDDFSIRNQTQITETFSETARTLTLLLGSVAGVSLLVGGIGIMNIMLVSVTERTREIGLRLSVGARSSDILIQFLVESILLSLSGGIIGILIAFGVSFVLNTYNIMTMIITPFVVIISFFFSAAVGVFFGFYPARKAAALNPIDALRYE